MKHFALLLALLAAAPAAGCVATSPTNAAHVETNEPRPFDETATAMADVDTALVAATSRGTRVLLVLGGNWCHDSRGLAAKFEDPKLAALIAERYELLWVDFGQRDRNLDIAKRFGVGDLLGTPTILIISADGDLLNRASAHQWRDAASRALQETYDYFRQWAGDE